MKIVLLFSSTSLAATVQETPTPPAMGPAEPPANEIRVAMVQWRRTYREEMRPVRVEWNRLAESIRRGRSTELDLICADFARRVQQIDRGKLATPVDPVVRLWFGRGLVLLDAAVDHCRAERVFALTYRLDKARRVVQFIDRSVERY